MEYLTRHAESKLARLARHFKVVLVMGARQVGKSTLLRHALPDIKMVVFDPGQDLYGARQDPDLFLDSFPPPAILDEIQFVPELMPAIKRRVDLSEACGRYYLTGSQNLGMLRSVAESLAGRVAILPLEGMTPAEMLGEGGNPCWLGAYLDKPESLLDLFEGVWTDLGSLTRVLWRGSLPGLLAVPDEIVSDFFQSYLQTYVERDVRLMEDIRELASFGRFLGLTAALTAQEINSSQVGRDVGVSPGSARKWLDLLLNTYQWLELFPYHGNTIKRVTGKRKGFLRDTGMACSLQRISSPEALAASRLLGPLFETWAVNHILRQFLNLTLAPQLYHWRSTGGAEVDLLLERDGTFYPIEIKCKTNLTKRDTLGIRAFRQTYPGLSIATGLIIYAGTVCRRVDNHAIALPWNARVGVPDSSMSSPICPAF